MGRRLDKYDVYTPMWNQFLGHDHVLHVLSNELTHTICSLEERNDMVGVWWGVGEEIVQNAEASPTSLQHRH